MKKITGKGYEMLAAADTAEILIYEPVGFDPWTGTGVSAKAFAEDLNKLKGVKNITVRINSPGGQVFDGVAIYNSLVKHPATINVEVDGMALSIASVIAMAGDTISIAENALMMIHDPWTVVMGSAVDLRTEADMMDKAKAGIVATYQTRSALSESDIAAAMTAETWYTAQEAVDAGFATAVTGTSSRMAASAEKLKAFGYKHVPEVLAKYPVTEIHIDEAKLADSLIKESSVNGLPLSILKQKLAMAELDD